MNFRHSAAVARNDFLLLRRDLAPWIAFVLMPLLLMGFVSGSYRATLLIDGHAGANGSEQAVPGMATMFALFLMGTIATSFFREHGWNTWSRLRTSAATTGEIMLGKVIVPTLATLVQLMLVFGLGATIFDLPLEGSVIALACVAALFGTSVVALSFVVISFCRTLMQMNLATSLGALLLAGIGGALTPIGDLPGWVQVVAKGTPSYWAMRGYRQVIIDGSTLGDVAPVLSVLALFALALSALAALRFRDDESKVTWG